MKKTLLCTFALVALSLTLSAHASTLTVSLVDPNQTGTVGDDLVFNGVITNNSDSVVNLDSDDITLTVGGATINDGINNLPFFLEPFTSTGIVELFDVELTAPFTLAGGTYDFTGDINGVDVDAETTFSVTSNAPAATPEPSSILLLLTGLPAVLPLRKRLSR
jgi:hypothetical protein